MFKVRSTICTVRNTFDVFPNNVLFSWHWNVLHITILYSFTVRQTGVLIRGTQISRVPGKPLPRTKIGHNTIASTTIPYAAIGPCLLYEHADNLHRTLVVFSLWADNVNILFTPNVAAFQLVLWHHKAIPHGITEYSGILTALHFEIWKTPCMYLPSMGLLDSFTELSMRKKGSMDE